MGIDNKEKLAQFPKLERITIKDLNPEMPAVGETVMVLQRNAKDNRDPNSQLEMGALVPEAAEKTRQHAKNFFDKLFQSMNEAERQQLDVFVVAADTKLDTPLPGIKSDRKRAVDTAEQVMSGIKESFAEFSLSDKQLLNRTGRPIELSGGELRDLRMFEDSPEFVKFLKDKYGTGLEFWNAFESDVEKETRIRMGAEGPDEIADRIENYLRVVANAAKSYHQKHPGRRLIAWADSHYDTVSPYIKKHVVGISKTDYVPVEQGAGIVIKMGADQKAVSQIQGNRYDLTFVDDEKSDG